MPLWFDAYIVSYQGLGWNACTDNYITEDGIFETGLVYSPNVVVIVAEIKDIEWSDDGQRMISGTYEYTITTNVGVEAKKTGNVSEYNDQYYIHGDFSLSLEYARKMEQSPPRYNFFTYNCADFQGDCLYQSATQQQKSALDLYRKSYPVIVPNSFKGVIKRIF